MLSQRLLNDDKKVRIVVPTTLIKLQTELDLELYIPSDNIEVIHVDDLKYEADDPYYYICDEIDAMLEKQALLVAKKDFTQDNEEPQNWVYGLASVYHSQKAYFFSATYENYHKKLLRQVFGI